MSQNLGLRSLGWFMDVSSTMVKPFGFDPQIRRHRVHLHMPWH